MIVAPFCVSSAFASPWGRTDKEFLIISRVDYFAARLRADLDGPRRRLERIESNTYAEYGLTPKITIGGKVVYGSSWISGAMNSATGTGFSEAQVFAQHRLFQTARSSGGARLAVIRPSRLDTGVRNNLISDGADIELSFLYGRNIRHASPKLFATTELGFRKRFSKSADQIRASSLIGVEANSAFLFLLEARAEYSIRNEKMQGADYDIIKIQPSIVWRRWKTWSLQVGVEQEVSGRNIDLGRTIFVGLWSRF